MNIDGIEVKEIPIKPAEIELDKDGKNAKYVDQDGKQIKKIQLQSAEYKWVYEDGKEYLGTSFKCLKGKPVAGFSKTTTVKSEIVHVSDKKYFLVNELTYLLVGQEFKDRMKELSQESKALVFKYVNRGFKVYKAFVEYDQELDKVIMRAYRGDLRKIDLTENEKTKEVEDTSAVETLDLDALDI